MILTTTVIGVIPILKCSLIIHTQPPVELRVYLVTSGDLNFSRHFSNQVIVVFPMLIVYHAGTNNDDGITTRTQLLKYIRCLVGNSSMLHRPESCSKR